jgi:hypothetical protein
MLLALLMTAWTAGGGVSAVQVQPQGSAAGERADGSVVRVTVGQGAVPLYGSWKFKVGDSPVDPKTGRAVWAEPGFDDSGWETVDLAPKDGTIDNSTGITGTVPGWGGKGHPGYWGYAWYRIRVQVRSRPGEKLALEGPADVDDGYQVFDNGELVGNFGDFRGSRPVVYLERPKLFPLALQRKDGATIGAGGAGSDESEEGESTRVLAFRVWMAPEDVSVVEGGGMHTAPVLGEAGAVRSDYQMRWRQVIGTYALVVVRASLIGLLAVVAFSLVFFDRSDRV